MGEWGRRPGLRPIHAVSPAAACSPASSTSFYHHHHYCYRRRYRYRHHHPTSALTYLVTPSLPFTRHTHARARIPHAISVFLPLPFFLFFSIVSTIFSSSSSRYLIVILKIHFIVFYLSLILDQTRARARAHTHTQSLSFSLARSRSSLFSASHAHAHLSCPTKKIVSLIHNSLLLFIILISLPYI